MKENIEEEKVIKNMKIFARTHQDRTIITAEEIDIILKLVEKLQKENEKLKNRWDKDTHKLQNDLDIANAEIIRLKKGGKKCTI